MKNIIQQLNLQAGDRIVVPKSGIGFIYHHAIYLGQDSCGNHLIAENNSDVGVRIIYANDFFHTVTEITRVERFKGNNHQKNEAIKRAWSLVGKAYHLIEFNCEHYANYVQHKEVKSEQVSTPVLSLGIGLILLGGVALLTD